MLAKGKTAINKVYSKMTANNGNISENMPVYGLTSLKTIIVLSDVIKAVLYKGIV